MGKDIEKVSKIASKFFNQSVIKVTPLLGKGSVNKVFGVETLNDSKAVVRMRDEVAALEEYEKEAWCIERAKALGVPVPAVLDFGLFEGEAYMIQTFFGGAEGGDSVMPKADIWRKLGEYAKTIHSIEVAGFGLKLSDMTGGDSQKSWLEYVDYNIESLAGDDELIKLGVYTKSGSKIIRNIFENLKERRFNFGLNHGDISLKNVTVDERGNVGLLDWGSAEASIVPHHDLIELLKMKMLENDPADTEFQSFLNGYEISPDEFGEMLPELEGLLLLRAFDKLRWALDWKVGNLEDYVSHAKAAAERITGRE